jgi:beta-lactamase class A
VNALVTSRKVSLDIEVPPGITWSIQIRAHHLDVTLFEHEPDAVCATASIGKILLLITVAQRLTDGSLEPTRPVSRLGVAPIDDSGLWQHLHVDDLPVADACALVGATSDNLATNVLIDLIGLDAVATTTGMLGLTSTALHDVVRHERRPEHPTALSTGNASELVALCSELASPRVLTPSVAEQVTAWVSLNTDLSMVAGSFGLDPLAHLNPDRNVLLWNKSGTNCGVRCDVGLVTHGDEKLAYAALANWRPSGDRDTRRDDVLRTMRAMGQAMHDWLLAADQ